MNSVPVRYLMLWIMFPARVTAAETDYLRDVKPLLQQKCYACHGAFQQQGGLRVDTAAALLRGGESGSPIAAGDSVNSQLVRILTGEDGFRMPPENEGAPLTSAEIAVIRSWIDAGAPIPESEEPQTDPRRWWSYQPIKRPALPEVKDAEWCMNEVDRFVAARRESDGLPHVGEASKSFWLRRVYLDLIGLAPTRKELQAFLTDESASAYEDVVDNLLSRPQYGERWGRHWMDVWRYSDWYGSRGINEIRYSQRHIWRWRDWIVQSLNKDKGYDQMIREMLAADEIAADDLSNLPATGFLGRNWYKFDRNVWMFETVERTGEAFLGLTLRCARCHDHKFDPVTQEEYYQFRAFFEPHDVRTDPISALTPTVKDATLGEVLSDGVPLVFDKTPDVPTYRFERGDSRHPDKSKPLAPGVPAALGGGVDVTPIELPAEAWYPILRKGVRETLVDKARGQVTAAEEQLSQATQKANDASARLVSRQQNPEAGQTRVYLDDDFSAAKPDVWKTLRGDWKYQGDRLVQSAVTSFATMVTTDDIPGDFQVCLKYRTLAPGTYRSVGFSFDYIDQGNSQDIYTSTGDSRQSVQAFHRINGKQVYPQAGIVSTALSVGEETTLEVSVVGSRLTIDLNGERRLEYAMPEKRRAGKFALWVHQGAAEFLKLKITRLADSIETLEQKKKDAEHQIRVTQAELDLAHGELHSLQKRLNAEVQRYIDGNVSEADQLASGAVAAEQNVAVLKAKLDILKAPDSGEQRAKAETALKNAQAAADNPTGEYLPVGKQYPRTSTGRRTALANWIASAQNPRTARVAANQIWMRHFGRPLVATPENFGLNGRKPTHPELLNWLAAELMSNNWRMKPLHRKLVLSATYRMSSSVNHLADKSESSAIKSDPENRFYWRMNSRRMEAEVVRDATLGIASRLDLTMGGPELAEGQGEKILRRSLYFRNTPNEKMPMLEVFDQADPNGCYRRKESVVPHQSLAAMNSGLTQDSARIIAEQLAVEQDFITAAFETVLNRRPAVDEAARCGTFLKEHPQVVAAESEFFSTGGTATRGPAKDPQQRARENLIHVLFLHNDFVTIR